ncbi:MAG: hypothetical protein HFH87_09545 [Lachnospiraceae bacterium]|nr:hypothetical protein [Lachnospiraceae bacterium]
MRTHIWKKLKTARVRRKADRICKGHMQPAQSGMRVQFLLTADSHTDGDVYRDRNDQLRISMAGLNRYAAGDTAVVMAGDITNAGNPSEYPILKAMVTRYLTRCRVFPAMGNHDSQGTSVNPDFRKACGLFRDFLRFCDLPDENCYYAVKHGGVYCIALATERMLKDDGFVSRTQLDFLNTALDRAVEERCPVILVNHQPLNGTNGVERKWPEGNFEQSRAVRELAQAHADAGITVLLVSGHLHAPFDRDSFQKLGERFYALNLPAFLDKDGDQGGAGVAAKFYADRLELQKVDFHRGKTLGDSRVIEL